MSFFDAMRFVNWLENGQGSGSTESGVYTIGNGSNEVRNSSATYFIPNENEWYKAAYHKNDGATGNYWDYPTSSDEIPFSDQPPGSEAPVQSNTVNFYRDDGVANGFDDGYAVTGSPSLDPSQNHLTDAGAFSASLSPYGTFDQGGNVFEWTEALMFSFSDARNLRGGGWTDDSSRLAAPIRVNAAPPGVRGKPRRFSRRKYCPRVKFAVAGGHSGRGTADDPTHVIG